MAISTADGQVVVALVLDASDVSKGVRLANGEVQRFEQGTTKGQRGLDRMTGAVKAFVAIQLAQHLRRAVTEMFRLGTAVEEQASKFSTVFGPAARGLDQELEGIANMMGLTQTEARGLTSTVGAVVQGMGFGQQASADFSAEILKLSGDLVSFSNVEGGTEQVTRALTSALTGEREALKTLGIVITEEDVKQRQAQRSAEGHADALTRQGKATATLELITERAGVAIGDLERTQDSTANTARRVSAELREQAETFAQMLLPTFGFVLSALDDIIKKSAGGAAALSRFAAEGVFETVAKLVELIRAVLRATDAIAAATGAGVGLGEVLGWLQDDLNKITRTIDLFGKASLRAAIAINNMKAAWLSMRIGTQQASVNLFGGDDAHIKQMRQDLMGLANDTVTLRGELASYETAQADAAASTAEWREKLEEALDEIGSLTGSLSTDLNPTLDTTEKKGKAAADAIKDLRDSIKALRLELDQKLAMTPKDLGGLLLEKENIEGRIADVERFARTVAFFGAQLAAFAETAQAPALQSGLRGLSLSRSFAAGEGARRESARENASGISNEELDLILSDLETFADKYEELAERTRTAVDKGTAKIVEGIEEPFAGLDEAIERSMEEAAEALVTGIANLAVGNATAEEVIGSLLGVFAGMLEQLGKIAIATAIGIKGIRKSLESLNPLHAAAAAVALFALAAIIRSQVRSVGSNLDRGASGGVAGGSVSATSAQSAPLFLPQAAQPYAPPGATGAPPAPVVEVHNHYHGHIENLMDKMETQSKVRTQSGRQGLDL